MRSFLLRYMISSIVFYISIYNFSISFCMNLPNAREDDIINNIVNATDDEFVYIKKSYFYSATQNHGISKKEENEEEKNFIYALVHSSYTRSSEIDNLIIFLKKYHNNALYPKNNLTFLEGITHMSDASKSVYQLSKITQGVDEQSKTSHLKSPTYKDKISAFSSSALGEAELVHSISAQFHQALTCFKSIITPSIVTTTNHRSQVVYDYSAVFAYAKIATLFNQFHAAYQPLVTITPSHSFPFSFAIPALLKYVKAHIQYSSHIKPLMYKQHTSYQREKLHEEAKTYNKYYVWCPSLTLFFMPPKNY